MKAHKTLDLRTERGRKIYHEISLWYPSLDYGWQQGKEYLYAEGYNVIIDHNGKGHYLGSFR